MNPGSLTSQVAAGFVGAANRIDEMAEDLEISRGRVTVVGRILKFGASVVAVAAIPIIVLESLTRPAALPSQGALK